jgi:hypothetical protein
MTFRIVLPVCVFLASTIPAFGVTPEVRIYVKNSNGFEVMLAGALSTSAHGTSVVDRKERSTYTLEVVDGTTLGFYESILLATSFPMKSSSLATVGFARLVSTETGKVYASFSLADVAGRGPGNVAEVCATSLRRALRGRGSLPAH